MIELHRRESVVECYATTELVRVSAESSGSDPDTTPLTAQGSASEGYTPTTSETASVDFSDTSNPSVNQIQLRNRKHLPLRKETVLYEQQRDERRVVPSAKIAMADQQPEEVAVEAPAKDKLEKMDYNVLAHIKRIPSLLSVYDALLLSDENREALTLQKPPLYERSMVEADHKIKEVMSAGIKLSHKDMLLKDSDHN